MYMRKLFFQTDIAFLYDKSRKKDVLVQNAQTKGVKIGEKMYNILLKKVLTNGEVCAIIYLALEGSGHHKPLK